MVPVGPTGRVFFMDQTFDGPAGPNLKASLADRE